VRKVGDSQGSIGKIKQSARFPQRFDLKPNRMKDGKELRRKAEGYADGAYAGAYAEHAGHFRCLRRTVKRQRTKLGINLCQSNRKLA
jgi:hypothetical protein